MFDPVIDNPFERFKAFFIGLFLLFIGIFFIKLYKGTGHFETYDEKVDAANYVARWDIKKVYDENEEITLEAETVKKQAETFLHSAPTAVISTTTKAPNAK